MSRPAPRTIRTAITAALAGLLVSATLSTSGAPAVADGSRTTRPVARATANPPTPGDFTGYGFDQCLAPTQATMDRWLTSSPFLAVGIYISGDSRGCRNQPNLTPAWVSAQLSKGWRLLPITLGPQASCQPRYPRYQDDFTISPAPGTNGGYGTARRMAWNEATRSVSVAAGPRIVKGSTPWGGPPGVHTPPTPRPEAPPA